MKKTYDVMHKVIRVTAGDHALLLELSRQSGIPLAEALHLALARDQSSKIFEGGYRMPFKLIAQADSITNVRIGAKVAKRHNEDPKVLIDIKFSVPAGDIAKVGPLLELERKQASVRALFYVEEAQQTLDAAVVDAQSGMKPCPNCQGTGEIHDQDGHEVLAVSPCTVCKATGKVPKDWSPTGVPAAAQGAGAADPAQAKATEGAPAGAGEVATEAGGGTASVAGQAEVAAEKPQKPCPACDATGEVLKDDGKGGKIIRPCAVCLGTLQVPVEPAEDTEADRLAAEQAGQVETSDQAFAKLEGAVREPAAGAASGAASEPKRRTRAASKKGAAAVVPNTEELKASQAGNNGSGQGRAEVIGSKAAQGEQALPRL